MRVRASLINYERETTDFLTSWTRIYSCSCTDSHRNPLFRNLYFSHDSAHHLDDDHGTAPSSCYTRNFSSL